MPKRGQDDSASGPGRREKHSIFIRTDVLDRARNCAASLAGAPEFLTFGRLIEIALDRELTRLEKLYNKGAVFPPRPQELRGGRRPKTT